MLEFKNITIEFSGVRALDNVSFSIEKGKTIGLCGENGAGKSTLGKILAGVIAYGSYQGDVIYNGTVVQFHSTKDARENGIFIVHQELNLIGELTVAENIFINDFPSKNGVIDFEKMNRMAVEVLSRIDLYIEPTIKVKNLSVSQQQMIEIAKTLATDPEVIIFDEPTSSLSESEVSRLLEIIKILKEQNVTMIYISHKLDEIFEICDSVVVLKDGQYMGEANIEDIDKDRIISWMVGRELKSLYPEKNRLNIKNEIALKVENWNVFDPNGNQIVEDVSFHINKGEILGIYGLVGSGRSELVNSIFQGKEIQSSGNLYINGENVRIKNPNHAIKHGIALVTEDRKETGLFYDLSVGNNISIASLSKVSNGFGIINKHREMIAIESMVEKFRVKVANTNHKIKTLSGGNQQKAILGKWLLNKPEILILDEPTRGVDVGAKSEIYNIIQDLANEGMSIIMVSSELPEILGVSDRILVMSEGKITGEVIREDASEELLAKLALGGEAYVG